MIFLVLAQVVVVNLLVYQQVTKISMETQLHIQVLIHQNPQQAAKITNPELKLNNQTIK